MVCRCGQREGTAAPTSGLEARLHREHALVEYANHANAPRLYAKKNHVFALLVPVKSRAYRIAGSPHPGIVGEELEAVSQAGDVSYGLTRSPRFFRVQSDPCHVGLCGL